MSHLAYFDLIILFFILGALASWMKSDLEIPEQASKFLSIFLLVSLGLKGGHEVRIAEDFIGFFPTLIIGLASCIVIPILLFFALKSRLGIANASALASVYGSVSAVTFITAQSILDNEGIASSGYMVAIMAFMEIPAILMGIYLYQKANLRSGTKARSHFMSVLSNKSVVLLLGGFIIGLVMNDSSWKGISPVIQGAFKGVLAFFLLDLGIGAQKQLGETWRFKSVAFTVALFVPLACGTLALVTANLWELALGDQILIAVLAGSASYIAAPAAIKSTMFGANPSLYLAMPLALTFPMNLVFGIPFYIEVSRWLQS